LTLLDGYGEKNLVAFPAHLLVGTSGWSCSDWLGAFYPAHLNPGDFLEAYARRFPAVEIDSTYYSIPPAHVVASWREQTPPGFAFAPKIPAVITHEKILQDCQVEFTLFLKNISLLDDRLGPLLLQFPYFNRNVFPSRQSFDRLLKPFLAALPKEFNFALEIRNKNWLSWDFFELLRDHRVAFALVAQAWMPALDTLARALDVVTGDFAYARFVGDHRIEAKIKRWDTVIEDKTSEMSIWINELKKITDRGVKTYAFFDDRYAGFAPGSVQQFQELWEKQNPLLGDSSKQT
jgi:uncharacterized protein YecE (DUF72 family)